MKVLFTGSSSFTAYWFIHELVRAGHEVVATFSGDPSTYEGIRKQRVAALSTCCTTVFDSPFGSDRFIDLVRSEQSWDLLCHHAAAVQNYKSPDFDITAAAAANTMNARNVLRHLVDRGCSKTVLTGSIFEEGEGTGSDNIRAFSAYGISKGITASIFIHYCREIGMSLGKFVIPNPFGPWEDERFTCYLMKKWMSGGVAEVKTPRYVRDNIHVRVLAATYVEFAESVGKSPFARVNPSGYIESVGSFVARLAREVRERTGFGCEYILSPQVLFSEPHIRINTDTTIPVLDRMGEKEMFDEFVAWYQLQSKSDRGTVHDKLA